MRPCKRMHELARRHSIPERRSTQAAADEEFVEPAKPADARSFVLRYEARMHGPSHGRLPAELDVAAFA